MAITPAYTRGPALLAQSLASMADAAPGRFFCGLGASSQVIVADWNGLAFENQYRRIADTLRFLRMAFSGEKVTEEFETFKVKGFRLARIPEQLPPDLSGGAEARHVAPGREGGRRGHPQLAQRRGRGHIRGGGRRRRPAERPAPSSPGSSSS